MSEDEPNELLIGVVRSGCDWVYFRIQRRFIRRSERLQHTTSWIGIDKQRKG